MKERTQQRAEHGPTIPQVMELVQATVDTIDAIWAEIDARSQLIRVGNNVFPLSSVRHIRYENDGSQVTVYLAGDAHFTLVGQEASAMRWYLDQVALDVVAAAAQATANPPTDE